MRQVGVRLNELEREKRAAVGREDYDRAKQIKVQLTKLREAEQIPELAPEPRAVPAPAFDGAECAVPRYVARSSLRRAVSRRRIARAMPLQVHGRVPSTPSYGCRYRYTAASAAAAAVTAGIRQQEANSAAAARHDLVRSKQELEHSRAEQRSAAQRRAEQRSAEQSKESRHVSAGAALVLRYAMLGARGPAWRPS